MPSVDLPIIVAGHICLDLHVELSGAGPASGELIVPGRLVEVGPAHLTTGGSVANTGLALHRLGTPVRLVGKVGADVLGEATLDVLRSHGASLADGMVVSANDRSSYTIVISPPKVDRSFLHFPGANHTFAAADVSDDHVQAAAWIHFGYPPLMRRMYERQGAELVAVFEKAHAAGLVTSLDMSLPDPNTPAGRTDWKSWLQSVLPHVDFFLPSLDETLFMLDRERFDALAASHVNERLLEEVATELLELGATVVGLKLGEVGFYLRGSEKRPLFDALADRGLPDAHAWRGCRVQCACFEAEVCGTTGAGDATIAGFISATHRGASPERAATMAVAVGGCSVEAADAVSGIPAWEEVVRRVDGGWRQRR